MTRVRTCERLLGSLHLHEHRKRQQITSPYTTKWAPLRYRSACASCKLSSSPSVSALAHSFCQRTSRRYTCALRRT